MVSRLLKFVIVFVLGITTSGLKADTTNKVERPTRSILETNVVSSVDMWLISKVVKAESVIITDQHYQLIPTNNWKSYFPARVTGYAAERWDCDDYAFDALAAARRYHALTSTNSVGIAVGVIAYQSPGYEDAHAANIGILEDGTVFVYDARLRRSILPPPGSRILFIIW